eukprot:sb/3474297/
MWIRLYGPFSVRILRLFCSKRGVSFEEGLDLGNSEGDCVCTLRDREREREREREYPLLSHQLTITRLRDFYAKELKKLAETQDKTKVKLHLKPGTIPSQHWNTEEPDEIDSTDLKVVLRFTGQNPFPLTQHLRVMYNNP